MRKQYRQTVELNAQVTPLILEHLSSPSPELLEQTFDLLSPITSQVCWRIIEKLHLSRDIFPDMKQESFLKWRDVVQWYDYARCPVVITWWRTCLRNHLLSAYYSRVRSKQIFDDIDSGHTGEEIVARIFIEELRVQYLAEFNAWVKDKKKVPLATAILLERVLIPPDQRTSQKALKERFKLSQGYISRWEDWLREKICKDHPYMQGET